MTEEAAKGCKPMADDTSAETSAELQLEVEAKGKLAKDAEAAETSAVFGNAKRESNNPMFPENFRR